MNELKSNHQMNYGDFIFKIQIFFHKEPGTTKFSGKTLVGK